jgi:hypothetical protein
MTSCDAEMSNNGTQRATVLVLQDSPAILELIEQALRDGGAIVFATRDPFEALDVVRRVKVDLLILEDPDRDVEWGLARDFCAIQPALRLALRRAGSSLPEPAPPNRSQPSWRAEHQDPPWTMVRRATGEGRPPRRASRPARGNAAIGRSAAPIPIRPTTVQSWSLAARAA